MVINALKEYYGASIGVSREFLSLLQNEEESIAIKLPGVSTKNPLMN